MQKWSSRANGKLLLTAEYFVLGGARALAVPTVFGQKMEAETLAEPSGILKWESLENDATRWFSASYEKKDFKIVESSDEKTARRLAEILTACRAERPDFLADRRGVSIQTALEFPRFWGLGTSSTLVALLAKMSGADPFSVLQKTFGGSGYDLAAADADGPFFFKLQYAEKTPTVEPSIFFPAFHKSLIFIYLGQKQDSREGIRRFNERARGNQFLIEKMTDLTDRFAAADSLFELEKVIDEHEKTVAAALDLPRAEDVFFKNYRLGKIKSLGAWGGDFVLATTSESFEKTAAWFGERGFSVVFPFEKMVLRAA